MKFLNFFKTTWGIIILLTLAAGITLIIMNWAAISAWWNDETPASGGTGDTGGTGGTGDTGSTGGNRGIRPPVGRRLNLKPSARVQALLRGAGLPPTTNFVVCSPSGIMDFGGPEACASCDPGDWCNVSQ